MVEGDLFKTRHDPGAQLIAELAATGFADAREIGRGGFGTVYRCAQPALDRDVAVKVLTTELDDQNQARFVREQRAMGRLTGHPNIVAVLEIGRTRSGRPYLVMPYHRQGSLETTIRRDGPLPVEQVLQLGIKLAGALDSVHALGIVHRDVKPANILFTDYGEPALTDFGIAHVTGAFQTEAGAITGSPAFTAPEVITGGPPTPAADVYGLGATLFCALTGHAAYERHSGEQVIAQFLRITSQPVPDLRESGISDQVSAIIEKAMARDPRDRPTAAELAEELRRVHDETAGAAPGPTQDRLLSTQDLSTTQGLPTTQDLPGTQDLPAAQRGPQAVPAELPEELTSFIGRRGELTDIRNALATDRLVTLTGIGGVGKTRLALRAAASLQHSFPDGVWLIELAEVRDPAFVADVVATSLGVRNYAGSPPLDALTDALATRAMLLVLDNCEQVIDAVALLAQTLLARCGSLHILATSREPLGLGGEAVVQVHPLTTPRPDRGASLRRVARCDAVTLFAERAASAVPGFELTDDNNDTVARICERLDGLPLAIELAAARLRALSPEQILQRLTDRYKLLTRGSRDAPARQQTLRWSIGWSYDLCTPDEQQLWGELSLFTGSFDLDDVEHVCLAGSGDLLDDLTSLVDKSVVIRDDTGGRTGFRILDTVREYGRDKIAVTNGYDDLRRRHRDWYLQLAVDAGTDWISPRQLEWSARVRRELPNLREAFEFALAEADGSALQIAAVLYPFWMARGLFAEGRRWLGRALDAPGPPPTARLHARALYAACILAAFQGDLAAADARVAESRALDTPDADPITRAFVAIADGIAAFCSGDLDRARIRLADAADTPGVSAEPQLELEALSLLGWAHVGDSTTRALTYQGRALELARGYGEFVHRGYSLWANGVDLWRAGEHDRATELLEAGLRLTRQTEDPLMVFTCLQALAWVAAGQGDARRAAVIMGAAEAHRRLIGSNPVFFPNLLVHQEKYEQTVASALDAATIASAQREGAAMTTDTAVAYAIGERAPAPEPDEQAVKLTKREREVAGLIAKGLTNKEIADNLVISKRTAEGHVDRILNKLGFTSRTQVAAWIAERPTDGASPASTTTGR